jgi:hypothetical protein
VRRLVREDGVGGGPGDYQLVEREQAGVAGVRLLVSPRVGGLDHDAIRVELLETLRRSGQGGRHMGEVWRAAGTIEVVREKPPVTAGGKVLPLKLARSRVPSATY